MNLIEDRTIALAGVLQACKLVQSLAREGFADNQDMQASLQSIMVLDAVSTSAVYGGVGGVRTGLSLIGQGILNSPVVLDLEILRYANTILTLQSQLYRDEQKFSEFGMTVERLSNCSSDELIDACSNVYLSLIHI